MNLFDLGLGVIVGTIFGVGVSIFYLKWKVSKQLGVMQDEMEDMFEMSEEMTEGLAEQMEDDIEDIEDVEEEKE